MPSRHLHSALLFLSMLAAAGCTAVTTDDAVEEASDALTALPTGTFAIGSKPLSGSYVARLTLKPGKKFEMDYVRRTTSTEPWAFNPWIPVTVTHEEPLSLRGTWSTFAGDHGSTLVSFDATDGNHDSYIFEVSTRPGVVKLTTTDDRSFELRATSDEPEPTEKRVIRCDGRTIEAVITLDEAQRRRGTLKIERKASADGTSPPDGSTPIVYTGRTGVRDAMAYEGRDADGNGYSFALREGELDRTSGAISNVGLGFSPDDPLFGGAYHHSLSCTIARN